MNESLIRKRALSILKQPIITKEDLKWFNKQVKKIEDLKGEQAEWEVQLDVDVPLTNRQPTSSERRKLSDAETYSLRSAYMRGNVSQEQLMKQYGVSRNTVYFALYPSKRKTKNEKNNSTRVSS